MRSWGSARWLTMCAGVLRFTTTTAKVSPAIYCSVSETATWARQPSQSNAKALIVRSKGARNDAKAEHPLRRPWRTATGKMSRITSPVDDSSAVLS